MKILIATDKFKGSLTALEVSEAITAGLQKKYPDAEINTHLMADGGDGSLAILEHHLDFQKHQVATVDPLGRPIVAEYCTTDEAAFIEVASASGFVLLKKEERNPTLTSTSGTGIMIADAIKKGFQKVFLFLGGSGTSDAGIGIASALGYTFFDKNKNPLTPTGGNLEKIDSIHFDHSFDFQKISLTLFCDVTNPLYGPMGAAYVYAPQKGATPNQVEALDNGLRNFAKIAKETTGISIDDLPGGGSAGGISAGMTALCNAKLVRGFDTIATITQLESAIQNHDLIISGEGKLDEQSLQGKVVSGVADLCKKHQKPLLLFVGKNELKNAPSTESVYWKKVFAVMDVAQSEEDAMQNGKDYLLHLAEHAGVVL